MKDENLLKRITINPKVAVGKPVIRGTRLTVDFILNRLVHGSTAQDIIEEYNGLSLLDIQACLLFAAKSLKEASFLPLTVEAA